ncbi:MAG: beta-ketoacyl-[acyl-carrier-protein] synthase family protein [Frankiaceae bacterium]
MGADSVVVTGLGIVSPLGADVGTTMRGLYAGESGVRRIGEQDRDKTPIQLCAPVPDDFLAGLSDNERRRYDRSVQLALAAGRQAWRDAETPAVEPTRLATVVSAGMAGLSSVAAALQRWEDKGPVGTPATTVPGIMPNAVSAVLAIELGAQGAASSFVSACASGAESVAQALRLIRNDEADVVVAGGTEAVIHPLVLAAFAALRALSARHDDPAGTPRPFDQHRDGFVLGEAAAVLVLERRAHARARGARVWAEVLGAATTCDAFHVVSPEPEGTGAARTVTAALRSAGVAPADVRHVSAHATATRAGDAAEAAALRRAFGPALPAVAVSALKSELGHSLGASGAVAVAAAAHCLHVGCAPPTRNVSEIDVDAEIDVIRDAPRRLPARCAAAVNSFGFGGHNVVIVLGPP